MKKNIFKTFILTILCFALSIPLSACGTSYHSKAGKIDEVAGTYKLTTYQKKDANDEKYSALDTEEIVSYIVVGKDGHGYYAYKDKTNDLICEATIIEYTYETDSTELIKSIEYYDSNGSDYVWNKKPGCGNEPNMGFDVKNHTFNYTISKYKYSNKHTSEYSYAVYTRVSTDTDLSKVRTDLGKDTTTLPEPTKYMFKNLSQFMYFDYNASTSPSTLQYEEIAINDPSIITNMTYSKYEYIVIDLNSLNENNEFNVYYKNTSNSQTGTATGTISFKEIPSDVDVAFTGAEITILGTTYTLQVIGKTPGASLTYSSWTEPDASGSQRQIYSECFTKYTAGTLTTATAIGNYYTKPTQQEN